MSRAANERDRWISEARVTKRVGTDDMTFFHRGDVVKGRLEKLGLWAMFQKVNGRWRVIPYKTWIASTHWHKVQGR